MVPSPDTSPTQETDTGGGGDRVDAWREVAGGGGGGGAIAPNPLSDGPAAADIEPGDAVTEALEASGLSKIQNTTDTQTER